MLDLVCIRVCIYKQCVTSTKTDHFTSLHMETIKCQTFNFFPNCEKTDGCLLCASDGRQVG